MSHHLDSVLSVSVVETGGKSRNGGKVARSEKVIRIIMLEFVPPYLAKSKMSLFDMKLMCSSSSRN